MKKIIYAFSLFCMGTMVVSAQNIQEKKVTFQKIRLPKTPLEKSITTFSCKITTPYITSDKDIQKSYDEKYEQDMANYPATVAAAEAKYQEDLKLYDQRVIEARENFKLESEEFKKLSMVERLAMADQKPTLKLPSKPSYYKPSPPSKGTPNLSDVIIVDPEVLANSLINVNGLERAANGGLEVKIDYHTFESTDAIQKTRDITKYNSSTKRNETVKEYYMEYSYKMPTTLTLKANGKTISSGIYGTTGDFTVVTSPSRPNMKNVERQQVDQIATQINNKLNDDYGYTPVTQSFDVLYVKNKKGEYDEIEKAMEYATSGYFNQDANKTEANGDLKKAIAIWESELSKADFKDSKARIDEKVGKALLVNLINANMTIDDLNNAEKHLSKFRTLDLRYSEKEMLQVFDNQLKDMKIRTAAQK